MTVRLTIRTPSWRAQVAATAAAIDGLVPVIKGNGYGFGRLSLAEIAREFSDTVAVGNVHELGGLSDELTAVVLTPTLTPPRGDPIVTIGRDEHLRALGPWRGRVIVKLPTSMRRYGGSTDLVADARTSGHDVVGVAIHPPLAGAQGDNVEQVTAQLGDIDPGLTVWLSHLTPEEYTSLPDSHSYRLRLGTALWHGDKSTLELAADVIDVRSVERGTPAGYRLNAVPDDGHLVMIGAGTANGVLPLPDGRSPFHWTQTRMELHEPPHMHTSMAFVPTGDPLPAIGDWVDVQRPLHMTLVDEHLWL